MISNKHFKCNTVKKKKKRQTQIKTTTPSQLPKVKPEKHLSFTPKPVSHSRLLPHVGNWQHHSLSCSNQKSRAILNSSLLSHPTPGYQQLDLPTDQASVFSISTPPPPQATPSPALSRPYEQHSLGSFILILIFLFLNFIICLFTHLH